MKEIIEQICGNFQKILEAKIENDHFVSMNSNFICKNSF